MPHTATALAQFYLVSGHKSYVGTLFKGDNMGLGRFVKDGLGGFLDMAEDAITATKARSKASKKHRSERAVKRAEAREQRRAKRLEELRGHDERFAAYRDARRELLRHLDTSGPDYWLRNKIRAWEAQEGVMNWTDRFSPPQE